MTRLRLARTFWIGAAAILVAAALVALLAVAEGSFDDTDGRILGSLAVLLYTGGAALAGLALLERGLARPVALAVTASAPVALGLTLLWIWAWTDDSDDDWHWRLAVTAVLVVLWGLLAATALLLARGPANRRLAAVAGALAGVATLLTLLAVWSEGDGDELAKVIAAAWIVAVLAWALVPVAQRFTSTGEPVGAVRVLATLGEVELVAGRGPIDGVVVEGRPAAGERLVLRRRG